MFGGHDFASVEERFVVPFDDLRVYSFNGMGCLWRFVGGFAVFGVISRI